MAKKDQVAETQTAPQKSKSDKSSKSEKLESKNIDKAGKKAKKAQEEDEEEAGRELKYQYPADVNTASKKKEFRRKARATYDRLTKTIKKHRKATDEEGKKLHADAEKELAKFFKEVMSEGAVPRQ